MRNMRNIFIKLFLLILCDITACVLISKDEELSRSTMLIIKSPGYPDVNYKNDTVLSWNVTAPATTIEILIVIDMDIIIASNGKCEDYLQVQEINPSSGNFTIFNQCGKLTANRTAKGNHLLFKFVSNFDVLTSKGFQIQLRVRKERSTTSMLITRKSSMSTIASIKSTKPKSRKLAIIKLTSTESSKKLLASSSMITKIKSKSQIHVWKTKQISASKTSTASSTTETINSATSKTTTTTKGIPSSTTTTTTTLPKTTEMKTTTTKIVSRMIPTSKILSKILTKTTHLKTKTTTIASTTDGACKKTKPPKLSTVTTPNSLPPSSETTYRYAASISTVGIPASQRKRSSLGLTTTLAATNEISTSRSFFSEKITTQTRPYQPTQGKPKYSTYSTPSITTETKLKDNTSPSSLITSMDTKTVILLMGLGVLEVMLIVIGALTVRRHRRRGKWKTIEKTDDQERTQNNYKETNVYDEIAINDIGKTDYESPYEELPEGVYDTTFKRRSHLNVAEDTESNTTRNTFYNVFQRSSFCRRSVTDAPAITFSTFKGPINCNEKKDNQ